MVKRPTGRPFRSLNLYRKKGRNVETGIERPEYLPDLSFPVRADSASRSLVSGHERSEFSVFRLFVIQYHHINGVSMEELRKIIKEFIRARDWEQYHAPKNLAMALSVEAAEIVEIFQWKKADEPLSSSEQEHLRQEIGDVLVYLLELANKFDIDIVQAAKDKMVLNDKKYPEKVVKGKDNKYTDYQ